MFFRYWADSNNQCKRHTAGVVWRFVQQLICTRTDGRKDGVIIHCQYCSHSVLQQGTPPTGRLITDIIDSGQSTVSYTVIDRHNLQSTPARWLSLSYHSAVIFAAFNCRLENNVYRSRRITYPTKWRLSGCQALYGNLSKSKIILIFYANETIKLDTSLSNRFETSCACQMIKSCDQAPSVDQQ